MYTSHQILWDKCLVVIKDNVTESIFNTWFLPIVPLSYDGRKFTVQVPSPFFYEILETRFINILRVTIHRIFGEGTILNYRVTVDKTNDGSVVYPTEGHKELKAASKDLPAQTNIPASNVKLQDWDPQLNSKYTFDNFFESACNRLARSAGEEISKNPGNTTFNPLFVFGVSGVGKTHLCHAIGMRIHDLYPEKKVLYVSSHLFRIQYTEAVRKNTTNDFLNFYQSIDVLILDDIQEFIGMDRTQNTFFHIFNHLIHLNKQLILTSDKAPIDLQGMEERLVTRLKMGLTAELKRPDLELRKMILRHKMNHDSIKISDEVFDFIAQNVTENIRDLEGILVSLMANAVINNKEIDLSLAKKVISQSIRVEKKPLSVQDIQKIVCDYFNLELSKIQTSSRKQEIVQARQITMYLSKKFTDCSFSHIGKIVGKKDHSTVLYACKTIKDLMETNKAMRSTVEEIESLLHN